MKHLKTALILAFLNGFVGCAGSTENSAITNNQKISALNPDAMTNYTAASMSTSVHSPLPQAHIANVPVHLTFTIPKQQTAPASFRSQDKQTRHLSYLSPSTTQLTIQVTPAGGATTSYGPTSCTTSSCVVNFSTTPGLNTLFFTLTDGTNTLATYKTTQLVVASTFNTLTLTANPVVNSVTLVLATNTVQAGTAANDTILINAMDAAGQTIVGSNNYTDTLGNPLAFILSVSNSQAGGKGSVTLAGPTRVTAPTLTPITAHYDGGWLDHATISVTATRTIAGSLSGATLTTIPTATLYSAGISSGANPHGITSGYDGNIWFTEYSGARIGRATLSGVSTEFSTGLTSTGPIKIIQGTDGNLYFTYQNSGALQRITPNGVVSTVNTVTYNGMYGITTGPDGNIWTTEDNFPVANANVIARFQHNGQLTEFSAGMTTGAEPSLIASGPDGNLWFTEKTANKIGRIDVNGTITEFSTGLSASAQPYGITLGSDNNLWFCEYTGNRIGRITPTGTITEFSSGISSGANPRNIISGPDGNLWFVEDSGARIARITTSGVITEYSSGFGSGRLIDLTLGPDQNIWFSDFGDNEIGKFVY